MDNAKMLREGDIQILKNSDVLRCPHIIMLPSHYRKDGSCKCSNRQEREMMVAEWEYSEKDFNNIPLVD